MLILSSYLVRIRKGRVHLHIRRYSHFY